MIRTVAQIRRKADTLIKQYQARVARDGHTENMGEKYIKLLDKHIGYFWDYGYSERQEIQKISEDLEMVVYG